VRSTDLASTAELMNSATPIVAMVASSTPNTTISFVGILKLPKFTAASKFAPAHETA
jgi:hypothetical protein